MLTHKADFRCTSYCTYAVSLFKLPQTHPPPLPTHAFCTFPLDFVICQLRPTVECFSLSHTRFYTIPSAPADTCNLQPWKALKTVGDINLNKIWHAWMAKDRDSGCTPNSEVTQKGGHKYAHANTYFRTCVVCFLPQVRNVSSSTWLLSDAPPKWLIKGQRLSVQHTKQALTHTDV